MFRFKCMGVPVTVTWWFWLTAAALGGGLSASSPEAWQGVAVWVGVVFVSIMVHEMGHALMARKYGMLPVIQLHGFGGWTMYSDGRLTRNQDLAVTAAGPGAGLSLFAFMFLLFRDADWERGSLMKLAVMNLIWVNLVWSLFNLLPVLPMDGGRLLASLLGPNRRLLACRIGFVTGAIMAVFCFQAGMVIAAIFLGFMAWQNLQGARMNPY